MDEPRLPPLALLPAFEAAGRLGSFKSAAAELHVTPSAISHQIKALEEALGVDLFERRGRTVVLSQEGQEYLRDVRQVLVDLGSATRRLRRGSHRSGLRLSTMDFVAYEFLIPRLAALRANFPGIDLRIESRTEAIDFSSEEMDAALRLGGAQQAGQSVTVLGPLVSAAVCCPRLAASIHCEADLFEHPLIELRGQEYRGWHAQAQARRLDTERIQILTLETYFETVLAAERGLGVAFGLFPLTTAWVLGGRLSVPLATRVELPGGTMWVHRSHDRRQVLPQLGAWLRDQYAALPHLPAGRVVTPPSL